ncbi:probable ATP-dependent RNA helicase Dbp45A [Danaus plexippus]|uniref:ATP-dependent RNA helicase Dbp45A n=1 Tax=Danaus plexippus plexippus TaxID=278856 RepID=A0A212F3G5_DANPL|nr:probable ATP-dependent RNA helicase Dbp45A [Danaus plexippus]OWR48253.1 putative ATP-dependent RNA helicase Dbp45A [Danaus plexippus plexippus]
MNENVGKDFEELGVKRWLINQLITLGIKTPTPIQKGCIPNILSGQDCIGAAKTGSGKTFAFALPILQNLAEDPYGIFALVLTPTHELAYQIADQFLILGQPLKLRVCIVTGGSDQLEESLKLAKRPHIVVAMPGRLADHISGCDTFSLKKIKYLVLDEADRLFSESFTGDLETIFEALPQKRQNLLFSATITEDVKESKVLSLNKDNLSTWCDTDTTLTVSTLDQRYVVCPAYARDVYLVQTLRKYREGAPSSHVIVFTDTKKECQVLSMMLADIGMDNVCLHGFMRQKERVSALAQFRSNLKCTLIATNVAARGLDIPSVDLVVNHKLPLEPKEYIHRVGRTARAGRSGMAISIITPYDILRLGEIEDEIRTKLSEYKIDDDEAVRVFTTVSVSRRTQEAAIDDTEFETRQRNYRRKRWMLAGVDPDLMEEGLEEMRRKRVKAAKKAKLEKIKKIQADMKEKEENTGDGPREEDIDSSIRTGYKKVNKKLMKKDDRFKDVIGKMSKIKRKAENIKEKSDDRNVRKKKKPAVK